MGPWPLWWVCDDRMDRAVARTQGVFDLPDHTQEECQRSDEFARELFGRLDPGNWVKAPRRDNPGAWGWRHGRAPRVA